MALKVLIADPDLEAVRGLGRALRQKGYQVFHAPDGSKALELSVLRHPDLVLVDDQCRLIDSRTLVQILRTNPRTEDIPVVLTTQSYDADRARAFRDGVIKKPFNMDEVLSRIEHVFRRTKAARELKGEARELEGTLGQLSVADLLQVLAMNRRTGRLNLARGNERGEIHVKEGRAINARVGTAEGEKALFRLLGWTEGSFAFEPGAVTVRVRIERTMDDALLEGMRQADEAARAERSLPPRSVRLMLSPGADLSTAQHPVTQQVVELLQQPRTIGELLDLASANDLDVWLVLGTMLERGIARVAEGESEGRGPLLGPAEVHALRGKLFRSRAPGRVAVGKVFVIGKGVEPGKKVLRGVPGLMPVSSEPTAVRSGFGTLGRFELSDVLQLDFCSLPASEAARAMWRPFARGAVGAMLFDTDEASLKLARYFGWEIRVPLVTVGKPVPPALQAAPAGAASAGEDLLEALKTVLLQQVR